MMASDYELEAQAHYSEQNLSSPCSVLVSGRQAGRGEAWGGGSESGTEGTPLYCFIRLTV